MNRRKLGIVLLIVLSSTACLSQTTPISTPEVEVAVSTGTFEIPTSTPDCLHADGVILEVQRISDTEVTLRIRGLQPGEIPYFTYYASQDTSARGGTSGIFVKGADDNGEFSIDLGLLPPDGYTSASWDIRVIHSRGVECATVTLP